MLQLYCSLTIRLFCVIYRTLIGGVLPLCMRCGRCLLQSQPTRSTSGCFHYAIFLRVTYSEPRCISASRLDSIPCNSFFKSFHYSSFLLCCFCSHSLPQKCVVSFVTGYSGFLHAFSTDFWGEYVFRILCFYCLILSRYIFSFHFIILVFQFYKVGPVG